MMQNPGVADSVSIGGAVTTSEVLPTAVSSGRVVVSTAGTRVQLTTFSCKSVVIKALPTNSGVIFVGNSTVASSNGFVISASESVSLDIDNVNHVWIDSATNGDGISFMGIV
jgi:hypothetical protein